MFGHIKFWIDLLRDWVNVRFQFLLDAAQIVAVVIGDEVDGNPEMTKTSGTKFKLVYYCQINI